MISKISKRLTKPQDVVFLYIGYFGLLKSDIGKDPQIIIGLFFRQFIQVLPSMKYQYLCFFIIMLHFKKFVSIF